MKLSIPVFVILAGVVFLLSPVQADPIKTNPWKTLESGLEFGVFISPQPSEIGDSLIRVLRIDPQRFKLRLLNASAMTRGKSLTAREWCRHYGLVAAINASMYQKDNRTSVSLMKTRGQVNNPRLSKDRTILAFDPLNPQDPPVKIIDLDCDDFEFWKDRYGTLVQNIRMISCQGRNVWSQQSKKWSTAAIGLDHEGKILFIHVRSPYSTHDLIKVLKALPLHITQAFYVDGGPVAQLCFQGDGQEVEFLGSYETGIHENNLNRQAWPIPNVIGVVR